MPSTRKKVYADNETEKNKRIYPKRTAVPVANANKEVNECKTQGKRKGEQNFGVSPMKKISKKKIEQHEVMEAKRKVSQTKTPTKTKPATKSKPSKKGANMMDEQIDSNDSNDDYDF